MTNHSKIEFFKDSVFDFMEAALRVEGKAFKDIF